MIGKLIDVALLLALIGLTGSLGVLVYTLAQKECWPIALVFGACGIAAAWCVALQTYDIVRPKRW